MYEIFELNHLSTNENGSTFTVEERSTSKFLLAYRSAGAEFGNHWHTGTCPAKNPEILLFVSGKMTLWISDIHHKEEKKVDLQAPLKLAIYPNTLHRFKAETDCAFLEFNSLDEHISDTCYPDQA